MADPGTLTLVATAITAATAVAGGVAAYQQGRFQSDLARRNAKLAAERGALEARELKNDRQRRMALARAQYAAAGVAFEGTPINVLAEEAGIAERDAQAIRFGASVQSAEQLARGRAARTQGTLSLLGGFSDAGSSLLTGYDTYQGMKNPTISA